MISWRMKREYWEIQVFIDKHSSIANITVSLMTLPYHYMCPGTFCQMFFTNDDNTLTGDPLILDARFGNGTAKRLYHPSILDHDRSTYDFAIHPQRLKDLDTDFVILCADRDTPLYYFDFIFHFPNLKQAWDESESGARIQVFDLSLEPELQKYRGYDLVEMSGEEEGLIFKSQAKILFAVGLIKRRYSLHLDEYTEITGFDPVAEHCRREYFKHLEMQSAIQEEGLIDFVDTDVEKFYSQQLTLLRLDDQKRPILE